MGNNDIKFKCWASESEITGRKKLLTYFQKCPIPEDEILMNLSLFMKRHNLSNILYLNEIYKKILDVNGIIIEFGIRWGRHLSTLTNLRGIYEPYNHNRKIVGFDTFSGFPSVHAKDGQDDIISEGAYSVTEEYDEYLSKILDYHESECPIPHIKKHELVKGDSIVEIRKYLDKHPETIIALAIFDFDLYEPTKACLESIKDYLTKGSILAFDELNHHAFPGETRALKEVFGLDKYRIKRTPFGTLQSFITIE